MNTAELADRIATDHDLTKAKAREVVEAVFATITAAAASGDEVAAGGFGRFKVIDRPARQGRNPGTGEAIQIAASRKLAFTAAKALRDTLNAPKPAARKAKAAPGRSRAALLPPDRNSLAAAECTPLGPKPRRVSERKRFQDLLPVFQSSHPMPPRYSDATGSIRLASLFRGTLTRVLVGEASTSSPAGRRAAGSPSASPSHTGQSAGSITTE